MSEGETKLADQRGKFALVVTDGKKVPQFEWIGGRILLSNKRLVLASNEGKRTIPLSKIASIKGRKEGANPLAKADSYLSIQAGKDVTLIAPADHDSFEHELFSAVLDQQVIFVKHPAKKGGVVQSSEWKKGRLTLDDGEVALAIADGRFVEIEIDDVGEVGESAGEISGEERFIIEVEHTIEEAAVETHISGPRQKVNILASLLRKGEQKNTTDVELTDEQNEVLMALYSGVSPFQIPDFVGMDVGRVESVYDELIKAGVLQEKRERREVALKARGRNIAAEAMGEE